jgi:hypothetical protein
MPAFSSAKVGGDTERSPARELIEARMVAALDRGYRVASEREP